MPQRSTWRRGDRDVYAHWHSGGGGHGDPGQYGDGDGAPGGDRPEPRNNTVTDTNAVTPPRNAPSGRKTVSAVDLPNLEWRVVWLNPANAGPPLRIRGLDPIPTATTYVDGSVTCEARGVSTAERCAFDAATNELVYDGIVGPDPGATTEGQAANAVVITFRTIVLPGVTQVANQALPTGMRMAMAWWTTISAPARDRCRRGSSFDRAIRRLRPYLHWRVSSSSASWPSRGQRQRRVGRRTRPRRMDRMGR